MEKAAGNDIYSFAGKHGLGEKRVTDACSGISPLGPSRKVKAAVRKAVKKVNVFPDPRQTKLRELFRSKFGVPEGNIFFGQSTAGIMEALLAARRLEKILIARPSIHYDLRKLTEDKVIYLNCCEASSFLFAPEKVQAGPGDVQAVVISNPNRVTGRTVERESLQHVIDQAAVKGVLVVIDEALIDFSCDEGLMKHAPATDNLVVIRTTANFYGLPGLELAFAVASEGIVSEMEKSTSCQPSVLAVEAAGSALKDKAYRKGVVEFIRAEKLMFRRALKKVRSITMFDSDSNIFLLHMDERREEILAALRRAGFFLRECEDAGCLNESFLSVSVMDHERNLKFLKIIRDVSGYSSNDR